MVNSNLVWVSVLIFLIFNASDIMKKYLKYLAIISILSLLAGCATTVEDFQKMSAAQRANKICWNEAHAGRLA